jgi:hypothetical protein
MALSIRFVPLPGRTALLANGRSYAVAGAATVDVPYADAQAIGPDHGNSAHVRRCTDRPVNIEGVANWPPPMMYDTTLGSPIFLVRGSKRLVDVPAEAALYFIRGAGFYVFER